MKGADEYYDLFDGKSQQIGRLFIQCSTHARGRCFHIFLLPEGVEAKGKYATGVEIYGITGGNPGWTETYGWLHTGKWQDDFMTIVEKKREKKKAAGIRRKIKREAEESEEKKRTKSLLSTYT